MRFSLQSFIRWTRRLIGIATVRQKSTMNGLKTIAKNIVISPLYQIEPQGAN